MIVSSESILNDVVDDTFPVFLVLTFPLDGDDGDDDSEIDCKIYWIHLFFISYNFKIINYKKVKLIIQWNSSKENKKWNIQKKFLPYPCEKKELTIYMEALKIIWIFKECVQCLQLFLQ